jgi:hypothetical protein
LIKNQDLTISEAMVLSKIVDLSILRDKLTGQGYYTRATNEYLSEFLYYPPSVIQKYIKSLEQKGYLMLTSDFEITDTIDRENWEFFESESRQIEPEESVTTEGLTILIKRTYLQRFTHAEALTFSYLDSLMKMPRYTIKKSTLAKEVGKYRFQSIKHQLEKYPNLDYISRYHVHFKKSKAK